MDPDEALRRMLATAVRMIERKGRMGVSAPDKTSPWRLRYAAEQLGDARDLAEDLLALDQWIVRGGFLPSAWTERRRGGKAPKSPPKS